MGNSLQSKSWNIYDAVVVFLGVALFKDLSMFILELMDISLTGPLEILIQYLAGLFGIFVIHTLIEHFYHSSRIKISLVQEKPFWYLGVAAIASLIIFGANVAYSWLLWYWGAPSQGFLFFSSLISVSNFTEAIFLLLAVVVVFPLVTELTFRGYLYQAVEDQYGSDVGILVTALVFGLYFLDLWLMPPLIIASVACVLVYEMTNSLFTSIYAMGLYQLFSVVYVWVLLA